MRFLLFLFLIPSLIYASFDERDCERLMEKMAAEWNKHTELIEQFTQLGPHERERQVALLQQSIERCVKALGHCDKILSKIAAKGKKERYSVPWPKVKEQQLQERQRIQAEIDGLQQLLEKVNFLYAESKRKAAAAFAKYEEYNTSTPNDADAILCVFNEMVLLFEAALRDAQEAFSILSTVPFATESDKTSLQHDAATYQEKSRECQAVIDQVQRAIREQDAA
jgi:hypothetical protein